MSAAPSRNASLDALRILGVIGVVAIHASNARQSDPAAFVLDELGRFAVPMFFVLSSYFWKPADLVEPGRLVLRVARRVLPAFVLFAVLMAAVAWLRNPERVPDLSPYGLFIFAWNGGADADYLWFLPALVIGSGLVAFGIRWLGLPVTTGLAIAAYLFGCVIGAYSPLLFGEGRAFFWFRNGVLFAPLLLVAGLWLRHYRDAITRLPLGALLLAAVALGAAHVAEGYFVLGRTTMGHDYGLPTAPFAIAMVMLFIRMELRGDLWEALGRASFGAYLIHPGLLILLAPSLGVLPLPAYILAIAALSLALAAGWQAALARLRGS